MPATGLPSPRESLGLTPSLPPSDGAPMAALHAPARPHGSEAPAPSSPLSSPSAPPSAPVAQVETGLRWMLKGGAQEAQLQLHPDSLGQVTIHLKVEGGEVHARLWITEPASVQVVREGRPHLELALRDQGLQLGSFDLQQGQRPFQEAPAAPTLRDSAAPEPRTTRQESPSPLPSPVLNPHHVELYA